MDFINDPVNFIANWLTNLLLGFGLGDGFVNFIITLIGVVVVASFGLLIVIFLIWVERKIAARIQDRFGPNRAGKYGILQTVADIIKLFTKEDTTPAGADKPVFNIAPILAVVSVIMIWAVVPFSQKWIGADLNVGVLYIVAIGALGVLSVIMAGWSSNNKFALLGAFRTVAQLVAYEIPLVVSLLVPVLLAGTMGVNGIVEAQGNWYSIMFWMAPLATLIFFISSIAEIGRTPFDLLEAESEIVAGFHIEYSGAKFAMIFAGEFLHAFTISALTATLFFGGWRGPGAESSPLLGWIYFMIKSFLVYFLVIWVRSTLPRIRIDHMLNLSWKLLTPLSLFILVATAIVDKGLSNLEATQVTRSVVLLGMNLIIAWVVVRLLKRQAIQRPLRKPVGEPRPVARPPEPPAETEPAEA